MAEFIDLTGQKINRWTVLRRVENINQRTCFECQCECGNIRKILSDNLKSGKTKSCGCAKRGLLAKCRTTHNMSEENEYNCWLSIKQRCLNENDKCYERYGGAGITLAEEWVDDFMAFYNHIGPKPENKADYSIDRIDGSLGYVPGNVRWATRNDQARNKRLRKNNKTGHTGVMEESKRFRAFWVDLSGKPHSRSFSKSKYGETEAKELAIQYRQTKIEELNENGAGYSQHHGK